MFHGWGGEIFKIKIFYFFYLGEMNVAVRLPGKGVPSPAPKCRIITVNRRRINSCITA